MMKKYITSKKQVVVGAKVIGSRAKQTHLFTVIRIDYHNDLYEIQSINTKFNLLLNFCSLQSMFRLVQPKGDIDIYKEVKE